MSDGHDVRVEADWFNDGTAGLSLWCETCQDVIGVWEEGTLRGCWSRVPAVLQRDVNVAWRARQNAMHDWEKYEAAVERHEAAKRAAIEAVS